MKCNTIVYWTNQVIASEVDFNEITPLYYSLYSQKSPDFESENVETRKAFIQVSKALQNSGIWVIDRGGDRDYLYEWLLRNKNNFNIRQVGSRDLVSQGKLIRSLWLAHACRLPYEWNVIRIIDGKEVQFNIRYVRLQNMMALLLAVFYFVAIILDQTQKLNIMAGHVLKYAKRVLGIPDFKYYALGDGLTNIFSRYPGKLIQYPEGDRYQLSLGFG